MKIEDVEQSLPSKPNFGLVVGLACATLIILFGLALLFVRFDGSHLVLRHRYNHPTSRLTLPAPTAPYWASAA